MKWLAPMPADTFIRVWPNSRYPRDHSLGVPLAVVMMSAICLNLVVAALTGIAVPFALKRARRDPAQGSSVVLTFVTDSMGFFLVLGLAQLLLI